MVDRPFWLTVRHATGQTWQLFEDELGERFTKFLLDNGYDSATFTEYNEDSEGNEFKSNTIVVLKPELIRETKLTEGICGVPPFKVAGYACRLCIHR